jgi:hypothetical protein
LKRSQDKSVRRKKCNKRTENPTKSKNVDKITYIWEPSTNKAKHSTTLKMYHVEGGPTNLPHGISKYSSIPIFLSRKKCYPDEYSSG